jgi:hypothetical protein
MPSIAKHHAEWLSLIEVSGPFLSLPVLMRVFPQGLEPHSPERHRSLRLAHEEWEEKQGQSQFHRAWIRFVLTELLELDEAVLAEGQDIPQTFQVGITGHTDVVRPDFVVRNPSKPQGDGKARMLVQVYPCEQDLDKPIRRFGSGSSPSSLMTDLLHATGLRIGLLTNGEQWMLVDADRDQATGYASWYANLWIDEPITFQAFVSLFGMSRFFSVADSDTLAAMLAESAENQQELTDQLGYQVRNAVEVLIQALDRADIDRGRKLLADVPETELYEAALTVMMRLVILFSAEERDLLPLTDELYNLHYAVSPLLEQLLASGEEEILERRYDAWCRLLATCRLVYGGIRHDSMNLPAYGGQLFDPDRFPFLEGREKGTHWRDTAASPLPVSNRTVLHLLQALQVIQVKIPGGGTAEARKLSFRALDIEQIGHVYEGLLDHTAKRAKGTVLGLQGTKDKEPEISIATLEAMRTKGEKELTAFLRKQTGRAAKALGTALSTEPELEQARKLRAACHNQDALYAEVLPYAGLLRDDTFGYPVVIPKGSVYVTAGTDRRSSGTHYTPRSLTEPIVRHTLDPLVYEGPSEGRPEPEWKLRTAREILELKVCDIACGSGAFLVQACRYLAGKLMEAWAVAEERYPDTPAITPEGEPSSGRADERLVPQDAEQRLIEAQRIVAQRCLYGVDVNPLACEMAKLSLWLLTLAKAKPFTFLDHAIRCGDSLLGLHEPRQMRFFDLEPGDRHQKHQTFGEKRVMDRFRNALKCREKIESLPSDSPNALQRKTDLLHEAETAMATVRTACDALVGTALWATTQPKSKRAGLIEEERQRCLMIVGSQMANELEKTKLPEMVQRAQERLDAGKPQELSRRHPFHWPVEFPEVFGEERGGFDAVVGNPPFMGGRKIRGGLGGDYLTWLCECLCPGGSGNSDLCAFFFRRAAGLLAATGGLGLLATNTIAQGDTRETGLEQLVAGGLHVTRAVSSRRWPGVANLEVAHVWLRKGDWQGGHVLDDKPEEGITPFLTKPGTVAGKPHRLAANADKSFQGSVVVGMGFVLEPEEAEALIARDPRNRDVLFPYLNGQDLNSTPDQSPTRWVINFFDWPCSREAEGSWLTADEKQRKAWLKRGVVPNDYPEPVAADYPDCYTIIDTKVRPERQRRKKNGEYALRKPLPQRWWQYGDKRPALYAAISGMERVFCRARVANINSIASVPSDIVASEATVLFAQSQPGFFALLQSGFHGLWLSAYASTMRTDVRYTPTDCFDTFPFPQDLSPLEDIGNRYYAHRQAIMQARQEGLTATYNRFHDPAETAADIQTLRDLHVELDQTVAAAYGWTDLDLDHGFHDTRQGLRFTLSEPARREVLDRLLQLNHDRYAEEVRQGLHDKKRKPPKKTKQPKTKKAQPLLNNDPTFGLELFEQAKKPKQPK